MNDNEVNEGNKILREQFKYYKENKVAVHIEKNNSNFYNGYILEIGNDMVIFDDRKLGAMPIHFDEIKILEKFKEKGVGGDGQSNQ